ncbi:ABC transporter ATP-binding protein [Candidatus Magnetaquicoccus inordinatus]|uniref:ABC transporter ATP-binding protein n=1 Tax=Candidatus Magnetaquicoccus inordinatus TaxID=2496818 RepID=UPI00102AA3FE|nr:ABC transporter ATP-binding protein [Candidatus Magnetaquicoccus inordinatus]
MIHLDKVSYSVAHLGQPLTLLQEISFHIPPGEAVSLLGPSGSGKSTLLALLAGVERPDRGSIRIDGVELTALGDDDLARFRRQRVGVVFQDFHLLPTLSAWENVALPLQLAGKGEGYNEAMQLLEQVGLRQRSQHRPAELSGGEQQRVAIARAFIHRPQLILADEPTGNLDQHTSKQIIDLLFSWAAEWGITLFLVTHDPQLASRAVRSLALMDGRLASTSV